MNKKMLIAVVIILSIAVIGVVVILGCNKEKNETPVSTENLKRIPENVTIEIDTNTVKPESVSIIITDNNEVHYVWGEEFRVQKEVNGEWKDLEYISNEVIWIAIAYKPNANNQLTQKLDIEEKYGKLSSGTYRIVKPVYDKGYIDIYSNEFEIK